MASLGELFIELGVIGDVKPLEKAIKTMKEAVKLIDKETTANKRLLQYLQDIKNARTENEKAIIKENFAKEIQKSKLLDEIDKNQKAIDGKKELAKSAAGVVKGIAGFVTAIIGAGIALNKLTNDLVASNQKMLDLTRTTDIAQSTFQKWGGVGKLLGVENAEQQLEGLNQKLFELMLTGEGARGFQLAGINPVGQDAEVVLEQLRDRIQGMNNTTATYLLQQMGIDPKMLHILRLTREEFEDLNSAIKQYRLTPEQTKEIQAMNIQLQIASIRLKYLKDRAILALMPVWTQFMASLARVAELLARTAKGVTEFVIKWRGLVLGITLGLSKLEKIRIFFTSISKAVSALITKIPILGRVFAAMGGVFARVLAPLTALYLLLDDIAVFAQGGDSLIGRVFDWLENSGGDISKAFGQMFGGDFFGGLGELFNSIYNILQDINTVLNRILEIITGVNPYKKGEKWGAQAAEWIKGKTGWQGLNATPAPNFITPAMQRNLSYNTSNTTNTDNRQINQNIQIQTSQPAVDIQNELTFARFANSFAQ